MIPRNHSILLLLLTLAAYFMRVVGAESSVIYSHDPQLVRQSLELGQTLQAYSSQASAIEGGVKYPLTLAIQPARGRRNHRLCAGKWSPDSQLLPRP